mmetsp:Transcript_108798/g.307639  ORF Transcript_108798/g.307639 Transcript_108798/m.307639 type:complete len:251 (-) Transcript_108798:2381-3133(-)
MALRHECHPEPCNAARSLRGREAAALLPAPQQVVLQHLRLRAVRELLHHLERVQEAAEDPQRELEHKLLAPLLRKGLCTGKVRQPVHEVETHIHGACLALQHLPPESGEERARRCLGLYKPAHVVVHLALRELQALTLSSRQHGEGGQRLGPVLKHIAQRRIVVADSVSRLVPAPLLAVPGVHLGHQALDLHDVVDGRQHEHRQRPLGVVATLGSQEARVDEQLADPVPGEALVGLLALFELLLGSRGPG